MASIEEKLLQVETFQKNINWEVIKQAKKQESTIIDMNQTNLDNGINSLGVKITPGYKPFTIAIKKQKGQPTNRVTLKDTGNFHSSIELTFFQSHISFDATDYKLLKLEKKYGFEILGITDNDLDDLAKLIKPDLIEEFRRQVT